MKASFLIHAELRLFKHRVKSAREIIARALAIKGAVPYVATSGGKDSTVVLDLVRKQGARTVAIWADDEWHLPETLEYISGLENCIHIASEINPTEWFTTWRDRDELPEGTEWVDAAERGLQTYAQRNAYNVAFIGLRQGENAHRRLFLRTYGPLFFAKKDTCWQCNPIHNWSVMDVWAYIASRKLEYNRAYDRLSEIGVPLERQRIGPLAHRDVVGFGQLAILKRGWPELFNRFAAEFPEARGYV